MVFIKNQYDYIGALFSLFLANNVVFMRSRISDKFFKKLLIIFLIFSQIAITFPAPNTPPFSITSVPNIPDNGQH